MHLLTRGLIKNVSKPTKSLKVFKFTNTTQLFHPPKNAFFQEAEYHRIQLPECRYCQQYFEKLSKMKDQGWKESSTNKKITKLEIKRHRKFQPK